MPQIFGAINFGEVRVYCRKSLNLGSNKEDGSG